MSVGMDRMISEDPFKAKPFYDSIILYSVQFQFPNSENAEQKAKMSLHLR